MTPEIIIKEALVLKPGKTYVIEIDQVLSAKVRDKIEMYFYDKGQEFDVDFLILEKGMKIATTEKVS